TVVVMPVRLRLRGRCRGHLLGRRRREGQLVAGRWIVAALIRARSRLVSSRAAPRCLITNDEYTNSSREFRDIVTRKTAWPEIAVIPRSLTQSLRELGEADETSHIPSVTRRHKIVCVACFVATGRRRPRGLARGLQ